MGTDLGDSKVATALAGVVADDTSKLSDMVRRLIERVEATPGFKEEPRLQGEVLALVLRDWDKFNKLTKQDIKARILKNIPRIYDTPNPEETFEALKDAYDLWPEKGPVEVTKSIYAYTEAPKYLPDPDEHLYPKDGWIGDYLEYAKHCEAPVAFHFWSAVSVIGAACRAKVWVHRGNYDIWLNSYVMLTASKAAGKSIAKDIAVDMIDRVNTMLGDDVSERVDVADGPKPPHLGAIRLLGEDSTKESIIEDLAYSKHYARDPVTHVMREYTIDSTGFFHMDELANFLGRQAFSVETKVPFLTTLYGSKHPYVKATRHSGRFELRNAALSILACCAPDWLLETVTPVMFRGGFLDRWRIIYRSDTHSPRVYPTALPTDPVVANQLATKLQSVCKILEPKEIWADDPAKVWFDAWYHEAKAYAKANPNEQALSVQRLANQLWKLAAVLCISDRSFPIIGQRHFESAAAILKNEEDHFVKLLGILERTPESTRMDRIEQSILEDGGYVLVRKLKDRVRHWKGFQPTAYKFDPLINDLIESGRLELIRVGKKPAYRLTELTITDWERRLQNDWAARARNALKIGKENGELKD